MTLKPLPLQAISKSAPWGSDFLSSAWGRQGQDPIGESWEFVLRPEESNFSLDHQKNLMELFEDNPEKWLGKYQVDDLNLLIKFIATDQALSVQLHPDQAAAQTLNGEMKCEAWVIIDCQPGSGLWAGAKGDQASLQQAISNGTLKDDLIWHEVQVGDTFVIEPGLIHAIGPGIVLYEIQTNSTTTYRVYDWDRPGLDGQLRPLHLEEAVQSVKALTVQKKQSHQGCLIDTEFFKVDKIMSHQGQLRIESGDQPAVASLIGQFQWKNQNLAPASSFYLAPGCDLLEVQGEGYALRGQIKGSVKG